MKNKEIQFANEINTAAMIIQYYNLGYYNYASQMIFQHQLLC